MTEEKKQTTVNCAISDFPKIEANGGVHMMSFSLKPKSEYQKFMRGEMSVEEFIKIISS